MDIRIRTFGRFLLMTAFIVVVAIKLLYAITVELPPDESGLADLLAESVIDTFQYEQLMIYYALPVSVPQGELNLLTRVFPDIEDMLPTVEQLEAYQPFDNRQVQRLFSDFPALADLEPVLRFNLTVSELSTNGEVVIGINKSSVDELRGHRVRFRYKSKYVSTEGSVALSDSGALWRTRQLGVSLPGKTEAQIGNFRLPVPGELFFGRFAPVVISSAREIYEDDGGDDDAPVNTDDTFVTNNNSELIRTNWLYGGSNTWNGVAVTVKEIPDLPMIGASAFYHIRGDETGAGGAVDLRIGKIIRINAALTNFDSVNTAHIYAEYRDKAWRSILEAGLPLGQDNAAPAFSYRLNYRASKESFAEYHLISYPDCFTAPSSGLKRRVLSEVGEKESSASSSIRKHALRMTVPVSASASMVNAMRIIPEVDFSEYQGMIKRIQGRVDVRARINTGMDVVLRHTARIFTTDVDSVLHTSFASLKLQTDYPVSINASAQSVYGFYKHPRNTYSFELTYTGLPSAVISPLFRGRYVTEHQYWFGLKTELHLYRKTWTGITLEVPVDAKGVGDVYVRGSSSYAF